MAIAASSTTFIATLITDVNNVITTQIADNVGKINTAISPVFAAFFGLYCVYIGFKYLIEGQELPIMDALKTMASLALVTTIAFTSSDYTSHVVNFGMQFGDDLSAKMTGSSSTAASGLDTLFNSMMTSIKNIYENTDFGWSNIGHDLGIVSCLVIILLGSMMFICAAVVYILITKVMLGILLSLGTIFICFAFFPTTRNMFTSWAGNILNFGLLSVCFTIIFSLIYQFVQTNINADDLGLLSACRVFLVYFIGYKCLGQADQVIAGITNGITLHGLLAKTTGGVYNSGKMAGKGAWGGMKGAGTAASDIGKGAWGLLSKSIKGG